MAAAAVVVVVVDVAGVDAGAAGVEEEVKFD